MSKLSLSAAILASTLDGVITDGRFDQPGLHLANDSRFLATHFSEPLTTYAVGWRDPENLEDTLEFLAPAVEVGRKFEFKKANNAEEFLSETTDDLRAIGADFKRVQYSGTSVVAKTYPRGLTEIVDLDNVTGTSWEQQVVARLQRRLLRNSVRRAFAGLTAAATNTNKVWGSSADPDQDVMDDLETAKTASGIRPNRVLYGSAAWNLRRKAYRVQNNAGSDASARLKPADLAGDLMVSQVLVSQERYQSSASAKSEIAGLKEISFYADSMANTEDPSNIKRFISMHDANQGGGRWLVYRKQESAMLVSITVAHYENIVITSTLGIRQITASAS
jgi:hypothetical protein